MRNAKATLGRFGWRVVPNRRCDFRKKRTLTNLFNARLAWPDNAHNELDEAVALACGWTDYTPYAAGNWT